MPRARPALVVLVMTAAAAVGVGGGFAVAGLSDDAAPEASSRTTAPADVLGRQPATPPAAVQTPEATEGAAAQTFDVTLQVDACWVAAVEAAGRLWDLPVEQQFSAIAENQPADVSGRGTATLDGRDDDTLDYVDADGGRLTFIPAGDPRTLQDRVCDATGP